VCVLNYSVFFTLNNYYNMHVSVYFLVSACRLFYHKVANEKLSRSSFLIINHPWSIYRVPNTEHGTKKRIKCRRRNNHLQFTIFRLNEDISQHRTSHECWRKHCLLDPNNYVENGIRNECVSVCMKID